MAGPLFGGCCADFGPQMHISLVGLSVMVSQSAIYLYRHVHMSCKTETLHCRTCRVLRHRYICPVISGLQ